MFIIDKISYNNSLRYAHPIEKLTFSFTMLIIALISTNPYAPFAVFVLAAGLLIIKAKLKVTVLAKIFSIPFAFICVSVLSIIFNISIERFESLFIFKISGIFIGVSEESLLKGYLLFVKAFASISCFYLFILTTPLVDFEYALKAVRVPLFAREMFVLIYRYIFIIIGIAKNIFQSQKSRMGYNNTKNGFSSFSSLLSSTLLKSLYFNKNSLKALESRGYEGELNVITHEYRLSVLNWVLILFFKILLLLTAVGILK